MDKEENRPPGCEHCTKPCTIHLTQIVENKIVKMDLCEECPHAQKLQDPEQFGLMDQLMGKTMADPAFTGGGETCPSCGFSEADFKRLNRFGCPDCYETFAPLVERMLKQLHRGKDHRGKVPSHLARQAARKKIEELKRNLAEAIAEENFESAAKLRDEIKSLEGNGS